MRWVDLASLSHVSFHILSSPSTPASCHCWVALHCPFLFPLWGLLTFANIEPSFSILGQYGWLPHDCRTQHALQARGRKEGGGGVFRSVMVPVGKTQTKHGQLSDVIDTHVTQVTHVTWLHAQTHKPMYRSAAIPTGVK